MQILQSSEEPHLDEIISCVKGKKDARHSTLARGGGHFFRLV